MTRDNTSITSQAGIGSAVQRGILGLLLSILGILGIGLARQQLLTGNVLIGVVGVLLALGSGYWIVWLFRDGLREQ